MIERCPECNTIVFSTRPLTAAECAEWGKSFCKDCEKEFGDMACEEIYDVERDKE